MPRPEPIRIPTALAFFLALPCALAAQQQQQQDRQPTEPIDTQAIEFLRKEGLENSRVMDHLSWICDVYGPRLTGSPNLRKAQDWAVRTLGNWGLSSPHTEPWGPFGRGWRCDRCVVEVIGDNPWPIIAYPKVWSPSLPRVEADVVHVSTLDADSLRALDLSNKVVFLDEPRDVSEPFEATAHRFDSDDLLAKANQAAASRPQRGRGGRGAQSTAESRPNLPPGAEQGLQRRLAMLKIIVEKKPLAVFDRGSKGDYGTVFVQGAAADIAAPPRGGRRGQGGAAAQQPQQPQPSVRDVGVAVMPQLTIAVEHYNRICRMLEKGVPVRIALEIKTTYFEDQLMERNVVAEIPGADKALDEVVMVGAHFDSWHTGTGCTDNGCGSAVAMEAMRLLKRYVDASGTMPRRTIRMALWSGEEQGLLGSRAYVKEHFGEPGKPTPYHAKLSGYFNLDNGTGRIRGVYLQGNEAVAPVFRAWLKPFHDLSASTLTLDDTRGTDHLSFDDVGLPGFQFIQDPVSYDPKTHHSNMDVWDHAVAEDLKQAATIEAAFLWHAAQRPEKLPRKPLPEPAAEGEGRRRGR